MVLEKVDQKHMDSISLGKINWERENQVVGVKCFKYFIPFPVLKYNSNSLSIKKSPVELILALDPG